MLGSRASSESSDETLGRSLWVKDAVTITNGAFGGVTMGAAGARAKPSSSSQVFRTATCFDAFFAACSSRSHSGQPHVPRFIPHAHACEGSPPSARSIVMRAGPRATGSITTNASQTQKRTS